MTNQDDAEPVALLRELSDQIDQHFQTHGARFDQPLVVRSERDGRHRVLIYAAGASADIDGLVEAAQQVVIPHGPPDPRTPGAD